MAVLTNNTTLGNPISTSTNGGSSQVVQLISAPRVYVKISPDSVTAAPVATYNKKINGQTMATVGTPYTGFVDMGNIKGNLKVMYDQKIQQVKTGIDQVLRAAYIKEKVGSLEAEFEQVDDTVFSTISGITPTSVGSLSGASILNFNIGTTDVQQMAIIFCVQNKLDGKEWQFYNPSAYVQWSWSQSGDQMTVKMTGMLPFYTRSGGTTSEMLSATIFP